MIKNIAISAMFIVAFVATIANADTEFFDGGDYRVYEFTNETMANGGTLSARFQKIAAFDSIDFFVDASSGNITTANVSWRNSDYDELNTETLTSGTDIVDFDSQNVVVTFTNNTGGEITVTGNILLTND